MSQDNTSIAGLLDEMNRGVPGAEDRLYALLYDELRRNASVILRRKVRIRPGQPGDTLQTTALVHEAYILLRKQRILIGNRCHFFGVVTLCMKRALRDYIKHRRALKRGREYVHVSFDPERDSRVSRVELDALLDALDTLECEYPASNDPASYPKSLIASLRLLMGWSVEEISDQLALPRDELEQQWTFSRAFVRRFLSEQRT